MVRNYLLSLLLLLSFFGLRAQNSELSPYYCPVPPVDSTLTAGEAARDNIWPGFGTGSRRQADMESAAAFRTADALGVAFAVLGIATVVTSRVLAVRRAREYDLFLFPATVPGGAALSLTLQF